MAELDGDVLSHLLVLDEAVLLVVLVALLLLLRLVVRRVGRVALLVVAGKITRKLQHSRAVVVAWWSVFSPATLTIRFQILLAIKIIFCMKR